MAPSITFGEKFPGKKVVVCNFFIDQLTPASKGLFYDFQGTFHEIKLINSDQKNRNKENMQRKLAGMMDIFKKNNNKICKQHNFNIYVFAVLDIKKRTFSRTYLTFTNLIRKQFSVGI